MRTLPVARADRFTYEGAIEREPGRMKQKDFMQRFRGGIWAVVGIVLLIVVAIMIS